MENIKQAISFANFYKLVELNKDNYCMTYELSDKINNRKKIVYNKDDYLLNLKNSFIDKDNFLYESIKKILDYKGFGIIPIEDFFIKLNTTFELILNKISNIFETSEQELKEIYIHYHEINKSNFWLSLLLCKYLNDKNLKDNIKNNIYFIDGVDLIKNRDEKINQKKNFIFFIDDCSYSGTQLNGIIQTYYKLYSIENINVYTIYISKFAYNKLINLYKDKDDKKNKFFISSNKILDDISNNKELYDLLIDNSYVFVEKINGEDIVLIDIIQYLGFSSTNIIPILLEIKSADKLSSLQYFYNYIKPPNLKIKNLNNVSIYKLNKDKFYIIINNKVKIIPHYFKNNEIGTKFNNHNNEYELFNNDLINKNIQTTESNKNIQTKHLYGLLNFCYNPKYYKCLDKKIEFDYKNDELCYSAFYRKEKFIFNEYIITFLKKNCVKNENLKFIDDYDKKTTDYIISVGNLNIHYKLK